MVVESLAGQVVTLLLVPLASEGLKALRSTLATEAGEAAAEHTIGVMQRAWQRVRNAFTSEKERAALDALENDPDEVDVETAIKRLDARLAQDEDLARELASMLDEGEERTGHTTRQIVQRAGIAVNVSDSDFRYSSNVIIAGQVHRKDHQPGPQPVHRPSEQR